MRLVVQVKASSKMNKIASEPDGSFTIHVVAPPAKGKANREIVKWISKKLGNSSSSVRIVAGLHSNRKIIEIVGVDQAEVLRILGTVQDE
jgi:hypothetical protein